ncbi:MAG: glycosyl hydrolase 108 family protein [Nitrospira sp.]
MSQYIFGLHDAGGERLMLDAGRPGWIVFTEALGVDRSGRDYRAWADQGLGVIVRLNHGYGSAGTLPQAGRHEAFAERVANWVAASIGCARWIIGNEPNHPNEWPNGEPITPEQYALYYTFCRDAILDLPGHENDQVLMAAVAPWCAKCTYPGNETGDWIKYFQDMIRYTALLDGFALHAYTHGAHPSLIQSESKMSAPGFSHRLLHFRVYREFLAAIPIHLHSVPIYITESNQGDHGWLDANTGWVQAAYAEIDKWNQQPNSQKIQALCLYRWNDHDQWEIGKKPGVIDDLRQALRNDYRVPIATTPQPTQWRRAVVQVATRLRSAPGYIGKAAEQNILLILQPGEEVTLLNETADVDNLTWHAVRCRGGLSGWIAERTPSGITLLNVAIPQTDCERAIAFVLKWEGGYVNDPHDPGGETNMGISKRSYPNLDIAGLTRDQAVAIYQRDYWQASGADTLPWPTSLMHFDTAVNAGVARANQMLKDSEGILATYAGLRLEFYVGLANFSRYGAAWTRRVADVLKQ